MTKAEYSCLQPRIERSRSLIHQPMARSQSSLLPSKISRLSSSLPVSIESQAGSEVPTLQKQITHPVDNIMLFCLFLVCEHLRNGDRFLHGVIDLPDAANGSSLGVQSSPPIPDEKLFQVHPKNDPAPPLMIAKSSDTMASVVRPTGLLHTCCERPLSSQTFFLVSASSLATPAASTASIIGRSQAFSCSASSPGSPSMLKHHPIDRINHDPNYHPLPLAAYPGSICPNHLGLASTQQLLSLWPGNLLRYPLNRPEHTRFFPIPTPKLLKTISTAP